MKIKRTAALLFALILTLSLTCCGGSSFKTYDMGGGVSIDMDSGMSKDQAEGYTYYYHNNYSGALVLKESFSDFTAAGIDVTTYSLEDYAELIRVTNDMKDGFKKDVNGNLVMTYALTVNSQEFFYYVTVREGSDAFWLINFFCLNSQKDKYQPRFEAWNNTIKVP